MKKEYGSEPWANPQFFTRELQQEQLNNSDKWPYAALFMPMKYGRARDLSHGEGFLMSYIAMTDHPEQHCCIKNKIFAKWMRTSDQNIKNMMVILKKKGYIETVSWDGMVRVIKCTDKTNYDNSFDNLFHK